MKDFLEMCGEVGLAVLGLLFLLAVFFMWSLLAFEAGYYAPH